MNSLESALTKIASEQILKEAFWGALGRAALGASSGISKGFTTKGIKSTIRRGTFRFLGKVGKNVVVPAVKATATMAGETAKVGLKAAFNPVIGGTAFAASGIHGKMSKSQARYRTY